MRAKRAQEQIERLNRAKAAIKAYEGLSGKPKNLKGWIAKRAKVSKNWLTRAIDRGDLQCKEGLNEE